MTKRHVAVVGGTQGVGYHTVRKLCENDTFDAVTLMARSPDKAQHIFKAEYDRNRLNIVRGDLLDVDSFQNLKNTPSNLPVTDVVCAASASKGWTLFDLNCPKYVDYQGTVQFIRFCRAELPECHRFVLVSSMETTRPFSVPYMLLNSLFGRVMHWKRQAEFELQLFDRHHPMSWTIVRPGGLKDDDALLTQRSAVIGQGDDQSGTGMIHRSMVADAIVQSLTKNYEKSRNVTFEVFTQRPAARAGNAVEGEAITTDWDKEFDKLREDPAGLC